MGPSLLALAIAILSSLAPLRAYALEHPPVLDPEAGCERWLGGASGNDPSVRLNLRVCGEGDGVHGQAQWSSLTSGWNVREVRGQWNGDELTLRDVRIVEERVQNGWRFCIIDRWSLRRTGNRLEGTYDSAACSDHATVWFELLADQELAENPASPPPSEASGTTTPAPSVPLPVDLPRSLPEHGAEEHGGGCTSGCAVAAPPVRVRWLATLSLLLLVRFVQRSRTRAPRADV